MKTALLAKGRIREEAVDEGVLAIVGRGGRCIISMALSRDILKTRSTQVT
ncbi:MAG: hypothetical protein QXS00_04870 [Pyrobaculum sp.]